MNSSTARYRVTLLRAGRLLLDGGGMFGVIPKVVWSRQVECDDRNRIELAHNCLLLERDDDGQADVPGPRRILIETGTGDKLDAKMSKIFGLDGMTSESALRDAGIDPASIDAVIVTHLHFDHAGGLTRRVRDGETADWSAREDEASGDEPGVKLTFPNARVYAQRREWDDAIANDAVMTRTYFRDHLLPLELPLSDGSPRLELIDSPPPFPPGRVPHRDELPAEPLGLRETEILPGITVFRVPGHTWGQQAIRFMDASGRTLVFSADLIPTAWHAGSTFSLSYDVEPYTTMVTKRWFLAEAAERAWTLVLDHEPGDPFRRVKPDGKGWWTLEAD